MFEQYKGKIVHFIGGINEYFGEVDEESSLDEGWIRIKNPVAIRVVTKGNQSGLMLEKLGGPGEAYEKYVDLWIPGTSLCEVRVLNQDGELYKGYIHQRDMPRIEKIILPGSRDIQKVKSKTQ